MSCGSIGPSISGSPALDALALLDVDVGAAGQLVLAVSRRRRRCTKILRYCFATSPYLTAPSISVMTAGSLGRRASNSSTTRGRPPVMSLVLAVSRGILASTSPGETSCAVLDHQVGAARAAGTCGWSCPSRRAISIRGCFFSSGDSMMTRADMPVFSSTCSCTV